MTSPRTVLTLFGTRPEIIKLAPVIRALEARGPAFRNVNVSSSQGLVGSGYKAAYVAAKHGAVGMAKALALELVQTGITVNAICPGWVENSSFLVQQARERAAAEGVSEEAARATLLGKQPTGRFVGESDVGALIAFLCSDAADQIRGAAMSIDGGWCAQ